MAIEKFPQFESEILDNKSSTLVYLCESKVPRANSANPVWRICRFLKIGKEMQTTFAGDGRDDFTQIADNRDNGVMFPVPSLINTQSLLFDANGESNHGDVFQFDHANQWSLSMWVKPDNLSANRALFAKTTDDSNVFGWNLQHVVTSGALQLQMRAPGQLRSHTFNTALTASDWQHVVFTYNGGSNISGARVYRNAVVGNAPASAPITASLLSGQPFTLGSRNGPFKFSGLIDQVTLWTKALAASEVTTLYNAGNPNRPDLVSFSSELVSWFPIGTNEGDTNTTILDNHGSANGALIGLPAEPFVMNVA